MIITNNHKMALVLCNQSYDVSNYPCTFNRQGISGFYCVDKTESEPVVYITFTGTDSIKDWIYNSDMRKEVIPYMTMSEDTKIRVYAGAIKAYTIVRWIIHGIVKSLISQGYKNFIFNGHSLGGMITTLAGLDVQYCIKNIIVSIITFNSPKVGNSYFVDSLNKRIAPYNHTRFVVAGDVVHHWPFFNFEHGGTEYKFEQWSIDLFKMHSIKFIQECFKK